MVVSSRKSARGLIRTAGLLMACATSALAGLGLVFKLITPATVAHLGTSHLLGLIGLLVLPVLVLVLHRRAAAADRSVAAAGGVVEASSSDGEERQRHDIVVLGPDLRDRTARRHRHRSTTTVAARVSAGR
jgi:hypothetical protein